MYRTSIHNLSKSLSVPSVCRQRAVPWDGCWHGLSAACAPTLAARAVGRQRGAGPGADGLADPPEDWPTGNASQNRVCAILARVLYAQTHVSSTGLLCVSTEELCRARHRYITISNCISGSLTVWHTHWYCNETSTYRHYNQRCMVAFCHQRYLGNVIGVAQRGHQV